MIRNGKITVAMLSYCLTTTLKGMDVSILPIIRVTTVFLYILLIVENNRGGSAYLDGIVIRSFWFEMSNDFTKYANTNQLGKVWLCLRCAKIFIVNITYWHPTPGVEPNWYLTPWAFMILDSHPHRMLKNIFLLCPSGWCRTIFWYQIGLNYLVLELFGLSATHQNTFFLPVIFQKVEKLG